MIETLKELCMIDGTSGDEFPVSDYIIEKVKGHCECKTDNLGNIICFKKGKCVSPKKIMVDAHMDEIGLIISSITPDGYLKFRTVGGIEPSVMSARRVMVGGYVPGVIGCKPIHLAKSDEKKKSVKPEGLYIDIGASSREEAEKIISIGERAVMVSDYYETDDRVLSKALDDRIGCAILIDLIKNYDEYDFYAVFSVQEEVGARGAKVAAFSVAPDSAIVLEATTAADIADVPDEKKVCSLSDGVVVSFMDRGTVYYKNYFDYAVKSGVKCQVKSAVAGGN
ncbi:MAG: M42 family peptidase, partial [Clostridia bacterium]|nr:M42 family peptidase [Clostridia bacterium]